MLARFDYSIQKACSFIIATQSGELPINPYKTIERHGWGLFKYTDLAEENGATLEKTCASLGSRDSATFSMDGNFCIAFNDTLPSERIRFTLAHEIGHIVLGHFDDSAVTKLNFTNNTIVLPEKASHLEQEANTFAANFLSPAPLFEIYDFLTSEIRSIFGISYESANYRSDYAKIDASRISTGTKDIIKKMFSSTVRSFLFEKYT